MKNVLLSFFLLGSAFSLIAMQDSKEEPFNIDAYLASLSHEPLSSTAEDEFVDTIVIKEQFIPVLRTEHNKKAFTVICRIENNRIVFKRIEKKQE